MTKKATKPLTKSEIISEVSLRADLTKKQVEEVLRALSDVTQEQLAAKGPGIAVVPGIVRLKTVDRPAKPARAGINPFTKEAITIKAKPASRALKASPVKSLKEAVQ